MSSCSYCMLAIRYAEPLVTWRTCGTGAMINCFNTFGQVAMLEDHLPQVSVYPRDNMEPYLAIYLCLCARVSSLFPIDVKRLGGPMTNWPHNNGPSCSNRSRPEPRAAVDQPHPLRRDPGQAKELSKACMASFELQAKDLQGLAVVERYWRRYVPAS